jgi:hypothetical protein
VKRNPGQVRPHDPGFRFAQPGLHCFEKLGEATDTPPKSLIRMFGPRGNPQARNLFSVIGYMSPMEFERQAGLA